MSDAEQHMDLTLSSAVADVGERSAGDGRESSHDDSPDVTTDEDMDDLPDHPSTTFQQQQSAGQPQVVTTAPSAVITVVDSQGGKSSATSDAAAGAASVSAQQKSGLQRKKSTEGSSLNGGLLPWGARKELPPAVSSQLSETNLRPGEFVMRTLFAEFTVTVESKIEMVMQEPLERSIAKSLQRGEDPKFDQLVMAFGSVAEHCLPSLLRALFSWYSRQGVQDWGAPDLKTKTDLSKGKGTLRGRCAQPNQTEAPAGGVCRSVRVAGHVAVAGSRLGAELVCGTQSDMQAGFPTAEPSTNAPLPAASRKRIPS
ncbi:hypothetical protein FHG87_012161 [Trinorchestia longiramus]|nr:hypothetical protein FHG87_012161 [Trinorchestia longiramus]